MSAAAESAAYPDPVLARLIAQEAGGVLLDLRDRAVARGELCSLCADGDRTAQDVIAGLLARHRPHDGVLSEEAADDLARLDAQRVWIIDPLDGTREFGQPPRVDWAVHVALWERSAAGGRGDLTVGAVAVPARGLLLATDPHARGLRGPVPLTTTGAPRILVSRTRATPLVLAVVERLGARLLRLGSAGCKVAAVLQGDADAYLHSGGQFEWDSAAPVAVARAAGLHTSRLDGRDLVYNRADPLLPDIVVCRPDLAGAVLQTVASLLTEGHHP